MKAVLALTDGTIFEGESFGAIGETVGEIVFNTSMTGYQEILTDPSYKGQIVAMTYPLIGNYGVNDEDVESDRPQVEGFIAREYSAFHSNWRSNSNLAGYLDQHGIIGIHGIDTRALTKRLRINGVMDGIISTEDFDPISLIEKAKNFGGLIGKDLVQSVTCPSPYAWRSQNDPKIDPKFRVIAMDFGVKFNILRELTRHGCEVQVVPATTNADQIITADPDGIFLSNGPGDPVAVDYAVKTIQNLIGKKQIFGICLGHQLLSLAVGAKIFKLKFGHRGGNQPVQRLDTDQIEITAQNHGFCVDIETLPNSAKVTHINLNDQTLEGIELSDQQAFSVQYHPEASPGPHDANYLFEKFTTLIADRK